MGLLGEGAGEELGELLKTSVCLRGLFHTGARPPPLLAASSPPPCSPSPILPLLAPAPPLPPAGFQGRLARHGHGYSATRSGGAHRVERAGSRVGPRTEEKFSGAGRTRVREVGAGPRKRRGGEGKGT